MKKQIINEAFCGLTLINDLIREIPNFRYTYFINEEQNCIVSEYVEGVTLQQYINDGCSFDSLVKMLLMINLALCVAQERFSFVHYDLFPWNIIIKKVEKRIEFAEKVGENTALKQNAISDRSIIDILIKQVRPKKIGIINF